MKVGSSDKVDGRTWLATLVALENVRGQRAPRGFLKRDTTLRRSKCPPFDPVFTPFEHDRTRSASTARSADRTVLIELRRFLAAIRVPAWIDVRRGTMSSVLRRHRGAHLPFGPDNYSRQEELSADGVVGRLILVSANRVDRKDGSISGQLRLVDGSPAAHTHVRALSPGWEFGAWRRRGTQPARRIAPDRGAAARELSVVGRAPSWPSVLSSLWSRKTTKDPSWISTSPSGRISSEWGGGQTTKGIEYECDGVASRDPSATQLVLVLMLT